MLGSLMMLASGRVANSPNSARSSWRCWSAGSRSLSTARIRLASEMSRVSTSTPDAPANAAITGSNERVASAGASSVRV